MKPYGQKPKKSKLGIHGSDNCGCELCNTHNWNKSKSRERARGEEKSWEWIAEDQSDPADAISDHFEEMEETS